MMRPLVSSHHHLPVARTIVTLCAHVDKGCPALWQRSSTSQVRHRLIECIRDRVRVDRLVLKELLVEASGNKWAICISHSPAHY
jgi:hypothetical protein